MTLSSSLRLGKLEKYLREAVHEPRISGSTAKSEEQEIHVCMHARVFRLRPDPYLNVLVNFVKVKLKFSLRLANLTKKIKQTEIRRPFNAQDGESLDSSAACKGGLSHQGVVLVSFMQRVDLTAEASISQRLDQLLPALSNEIKKVKAISLSTCRRDHGNINHRGLTPCFAYLLPPET